MKIKRIDSIEAVFIILVVFAFIATAVSEVHAGSVSYRYVKWEITKKNGSESCNAKSCIQVSEFVLLLDNLNVSWPLGTNSTNPGGSNPAGEEHNRSIDTNLNTKWLDSNFNSTSTTAIYGKSNLTIDTGTGNTVTFNGYKWATGNDATQRDPISWNIYGSNDNITYTLLDNRSDETITSLRTNWTSNYSLNAVDITNPAIDFSTLTPANGTSITSTYVETNYSITTANLTDVIYNWNGTNYTLFNDSLVFMMNFDNRSSLGENSTLAVDITRFSNNATIYGAAPMNSTSRYGNALQLDGSNDYALTTNFTNPTTAITVALWVKSANTNWNDYGWLASKRDAFVMHPDSNTKYVYWLLHNGTHENGNSSWNTFGYAPSDITIWHHYVGTYDGSTSNIKLYVDGILRVSGNNAMGNIKADTGPMYIGKDDYTNRYGKGAIDDVQIWDRALTANEIYVLYVSSLTKINNSDWSLYVNQSKNATHGLDDGVYTYYAIAKNGNGFTNTTLVNYVTVNANPPNVTLNLPAANYANDSAASVNVSFNCSVTDSSGLVNISLYITNSTNSSFALNQTTSISGTSNFTRWFLNLSTGNYTWSCRSYDSFGQQAFASSNRTIRLNYTSSSFSSDSCVNLSDSSTYNGKVSFSNSRYYVSQNITLCRATYNTTGILMQYNANNVTIDCNSSVLVGNNRSTTYGIYIGEYDYPTIKNCIIKHFGTGISASSGSNNGLIVDNTIFVASVYGIYLRGVVGYNISFNNVTRAGIQLDTSSNNNLIANNVIYGKSPSNYGLGVPDATFNNITGNNISADGSGIYLFKSSNNRFYDNRIEGTSYSGINIAGYTQKNYFYNNLFNNSINVKHLTGSELRNYFNTSNYSGTNIWGGSAIGGNFWANPTGTGHSETCQDANSDSFCDIKLWVGADSNDYLPLAKSDSIAPTVTITTPGNNSFVNGNITLAAAASDGFGVTNVTFEYKNSTINYTLLCYDTASPYICTWQTALFSDAAAGYDIKATAFDAARNNGTYVIHLAIDRDIPYAKDITITYPSGQSYVRNGQNVVLGINTSDSESVGSGMNTTFVDLTLLNATGNKSMIFALGSKSAAQWSWWNTSVNVSAATGEKSLPVYVYDNASGQNNIRGADRFYVIVDNDAPTYSGISDNSPVYNNSQIAFSINTFDNYALRGYIFSSNISGTWTNDSEASISGTAYPITLSKTVTTGNYSYKFYLRDNAGNVNATTLTAFTVDGNRPDFSITIINLTDEIILSSSNVNFTFYYANGLALNCSLLLGNGTNSTLNNPANNTVQTFNLTAGEGIYSWAIECYDNDTSLYWQTAARSFTIDTAYPSIKAVYPVDARYYATSVTQINYILADTNVYGCWYSTDNGATNSSVQDCINFTGLSSNEGSNTWIAYIKDNANKQNSSSITFTQDSTVPYLIYGSSSTAAGTLPTSYVYVTVSVSDTNLNYTSIFLYNTTGLFNSTNSTNSSIGTLSINFTNLPEGNYYANATATDLAGNANNTPTRSYTYYVDPVISFASGTTSSTNLSQSSITARISSTDSNLANVTIFVYNTTSLYNKSTGSGTTYSVTFSGLPDGTYYVNATANDTFSNSNSTTTRLIALDTAAPTITGISPANGLNTTSSSMNFTFNATDAIATTLNCSLYVHNSLLFVERATNQSVVSKFNATFNFSNLQNRTQQWVVNCTDYAGNTGTSIARNITVDQAPSVISLTSPLNGSAIGYVVYISTDISDAVLGVQDARYEFLNLSNLSVVLANGSLTSSGSWDATWNTSSLGNVQFDVVLSISANDSLGNTARTNVTFTLDNVNPSIQFIVPSLTGEFRNKNFSLKVVVQDFTLNRTYFNISSTSSSTTSIQTNSSSWASNTNYHNWTDLVDFNNYSDGNHTLNVFAGDAAANTRNTTTWFIIDRVQPSVTLLSPNNNIKTNSTSVYFNWSVIDNIDTSLVCNLSINSAVFQRDVSVSNNTQAAILVDGLSWADYYWNVSCMDDAGNTNDPSTRQFIPSFIDYDGDDVHESQDKLFGNLSHVTSSGFSVLNITVGNSTNLTTFTDVKEVTVREGSTPVINFTHNFSAGALDLRRVKVVLTSNSVVVNLSGQLQEDFNKSLIITDSSFTSLCVKDAEIGSVDEISSGCNGANETSFTTCLGGSATLNGITCVDQGTTIAVSNLRYSGIKGTSSSTSTPSASSNGGAISTSGIYISNLNKNLFVNFKEGIQYRIYIKEKYYGSSIIIQARDQITLHLGAKILILKKGDVTNIDIDDDGIYDADVRLHEIESNIAKLEFNSIDKKVEIKITRAPVVKSIDKLQISQTNKVESPNGKDSLSGNLKQSNTSQEIKARTEAPLQINIGNKNPGFMRYLLYAPIIFIIALLILYTEKPKMKERYIQSRNHGLKRHPLKEDKQEKERKIAENLENSLSNWYKRNYK